KFGSGSNARRRAGHGGGVERGADEAGARVEALFRAPPHARLGYARRRVDRPEDAADVVADTMLVAWRRLDEVPSGRETRPWLFGVARRVLANGRRGRGRRDRPGGGARPRAGGGGGRRDRLGERLRRELGRLTCPDHAAAVEANLVVREALAQLDV